MADRHILIVAVDGLRASTLGAYGNTSFPTPSLDELAAESFLFDECFAPSGNLDDIYRALWQSRHPLRMVDDAERIALPGLLSETGFRSTLVTDSAEVAGLSAAAGFGDCIQVAGDTTARADDLSQTALARLAVEAGGVIAEPCSGPRIVWVHSQGMYGPWDAPMVLQESLLDEGDPPPTESIVPPAWNMADVDDPDAVFRGSVAYAAQTKVLDAAWQAIGNSVAASPTDGDWLLMLLGIRAFPLGEQGLVGGVDPRLYAAQLHVPWLIRFPDGAGRLERTARLVSHLDLLPTVMDWVGDGFGQLAARCDGQSVLPLIRSSRSAWRDALLFGIHSRADRAIRTASWSLRHDDAAELGPDAKGAELFVRPDDRWEANDVAARCPEVVESLIAASADFESRIRRGDAIPNQLPAERTSESAE